MSSKNVRVARIALGTCLFIAGAALPASAQLQLSNEDITVKFGFQGQFWADWAQGNEVGAQGYAQSLYMRRGRFMMSGDLGNDVSFFFQTDDPNLGKTPKALNAGFLVQDAFATWKVSNALQIQGGEMLVPYSRQALQATNSYYSADISSVSTINNTPTGSSALRDLGFGARGYFLNDHLQYRAGVFEGERDANGRDALRPAGYLQYDFFAVEKEYAYTGTALGKKKILAVDFGGDKQSSYRSMSANVASDTPVFGGDEIGLNVQYLHFDGREKFLTIPDQNNLLAETSYYFHHGKVQPFGRFEKQVFVVPVESTKDVSRYGGGVNYYIHGQNLKWTAQCLRALPAQGSPLKPSNEFTIQLQFFYF
jgi:hypothetical protein